MQKCKGANLAAQKVCVSRNAHDQGPRWGEFRGVSWTWEHWGGLSPHPCGGIQGTKKNKKNFLLKLALELLHFVKGQISQYTLQDVFFVKHKQDFFLINRPNDIRRNHNISQYR